MRISKVFAVALAMGLTALPVTATRAQQAASEKDAAEMKTYRLTMDGIRKLAAAGEAMQKAIADDPRFKAEQALKKEIEALEKKDELTDAETKRLEDLQAKLEEMESKNDKDSNPETLDQMAKQIESEPVMAKAIRSAGLTPREYSLMSLVTFQAMLAHGMQKQYGSKELPKEFQGTVLEDNIKFVAQNEAEITRLLEKLNKKP